ncbi:MAG: UDP-N-acetylmuramate dehydrogenase [Thiotrichales bacterium]|nr:UDP-N-acetylmuramate dehydrogenase [Thiotrichales bacterium]
MTAGGSVYRGNLQTDVSMAGYCSWRCGGRVRQLFEPMDADDLCQFIAALPASEPLLWLGLGSNLLVRDAGFDGTVIRITGVLDHIELIAAGTVRVGAGLPCPKLARFCSTKDLLGAEFMVGIPGTLGGALAMNAGAFGGETWDIVQRVETVDRNGKRHIRDRDEFSIGYRSVQTDHDEWYLGAELQLEADSENLATARMREFLDKRAQTQPMGQASCGSVFQNPDRDHAARLIEASGLKGTCIGDACVSDKHANFIINRGQATATDIEQLIIKVQEEVRRQQGIELQTEVCIVGKQ